MSDQTPKTFPIMHCKSIRSVPWALLEPHASQAVKNHSQTLERLADRGGLAPCEAVAIIQDRAWRSMISDSAEKTLRAYLSAGEAPHPQEPSDHRLEAILPGATRCGVCVNYYVAEVVPALRKAEAELATLKAENTRLRAAIELAEDKLDTELQTPNDVWLSHVSAARDILRAALTPSSSGDTPQNME